MQTMYLIAAVTVVSIIAYLYLKNSAKKANEPLNRAIQLLDNETKTDWFRNGQ